MIKKTWGKPKLVTLVRLKGESVVLAGCKGGGSEGAGSMFFGCFAYNGPYSYTPAYVLYFAGGGTGGCYTQYNANCFPDGYTSYSDWCAYSGAAYAFYGCTYNGDEYRYIPEETLYSGCMGDCESSGS